MLKVILLATIALSASIANAKERQYSGANIPTTNAATLTVVTPKAPKGSFGYNKPSLFIDVANEDYGEPTVDFFSTQYKHRKEKGYLGTLKLPKGKNTMSVPIEAGITHHLYSKFELRERYGVYNDVCEHRVKFTPVSNQEYVVFVSLKKLGPMSGAECKFFVKTREDYEQNLEANKEQQTIPGLSRGELSILYGNPHLSLLTIRKLYNNSEFHQKYFDAAAQRAWIDRNAIGGVELENAKWMLIYLNSNNSGRYLDFANKMTKELEAGKAHKALKGKVKKIRKKQGGRTTERYIVKDELFIDGFSENGHTEKELYFAATAEALKSGNPVETVGAAQAIIYDESLKTQDIQDLAVAKLLLNYKKQDGPNVGACIWITRSLRGVNAGRYSNVLTDVYNSELTHKKTEE